MKSGAMPSRGESINHFNAVRIRLTGSGDLKMRLLSYDEAKEQTLSPFVMNLNTAIQANRLANFKQQRAQLEGKTTEINEIFKISRIVIFYKPLFTDYPSRLNR